MSDALVWLFRAMGSIDLLEVIRAIALVATAVIAFLALRNWQRQDKAERGAEFLDALIEATHSYIAAMSKPITLLEIIKIGMESLAPTGETGEQAVKAAIAYIQKSGERQAKRLLEVLECRQYLLPLLLVFLLGDQASLIELFELFKPAGR